VSAELAATCGPHPEFERSRAFAGQLQPDLWGAAVTQPERWAALRQRVAVTGLRNSLLIAIAPTATIASIAGCFECIEPQVSNLFKRETMSGEFLQVNSALVTELKAHDLWTPPVREAIKLANGSVQEISALPEETRLLFRTAWELPQRALIDLAAARGPFIDQSQSLNLFMAAPTIGRLSSMYMHAWKSGLKTTYYLRSRPATRIQQATVTVPSPAGGSVTGAATEPTAAELSDEAAVACSLENPETCEACQ
jgi:ribonucleoside-diphosphate reductase alpha chain